MVTGLDIAPSPGGRILPTPSDGGISNPGNPDLEPATSPCKQVGMWPGDSPDTSAFYTPDIDGSSMNDSTMESISPTANAQGNFDIFLVEVDILPGGMDNFPQTVTFDSSTSFDTPAPIAGTFAGSGTTVAYVLANYDLSTSDPSGDPDAELYVAQAGSVTLSQVDQSASGTMSVSATNLHLVQVTNDEDPQPIPNGKCYDIASFVSSQSYTSQPDGGM